MDNATKTVELTVIGTIHTPHESKTNIPIQPVGGSGIYGVAEVFPEFAKGLTDLDGFSHMMLLFHLHQSDGYSLMVKPFMDNKEHGIFATRSPKRPAAIGLSTVKIIQVHANKVVFEGPDMLNGSPLIDIKPFYRQSDNRLDARSGWLDEKEENLVEVLKSDNRFV